MLWQFLGSSLSLVLLRVLSRIFVQTPSFIRRWMPSHTFEIRRGSMKHRTRPTTRHRLVSGLASGIVLALFVIIGLFARVQQSEEPLLDSKHGRPLLIGSRRPTGPPNSAEAIFDTVGKNPGSAAHPNAPGRVRPDAPAQHELGRPYDPEGQPGLFGNPMQPLPFPELDPRFHDAIRMSDDSRSDDFPVVLSNPENRQEVWMAWVSYSGRRDQIRLARRNPETSQWGTWNLVPGVTGDVWRPSLSYDAHGKLWVIWSQQELFAANFDLCARWFDGERWGPLQNLTTAPGGDINLSVARGPDGTIHVVWQGFRKGQSDIFYMAYDGKQWSQEVRISESDRNDWTPDIDVSSNNEVFVVWDTYDRDNYDVLLRSIETGGEMGEAGAARKLSPVRVVAGSEFLEARPSVLVDADDQVWVAYEVGESGWGKDQGHLIDPERSPGSLLNMERQVRVMRLGPEPQAAGPNISELFPERKWKALVPNVHQYLSSPHLALDDRGRVHLLLRRLEYEGGIAEYWRAYALTMTQVGWSAPAMVPFSVGRLSMFVSTTPTAEGGLWVGWPRDNQPDFVVSSNLQTEAIIENVYAARYEPDTEPGERFGEPEPTPYERRPPGHPDEAADVERIRGWRARVGGKNLQILRGDTHRHTELSMDARGTPDGSVLDFYRYMIDAASMDFGFISDHQYGAEREYWWWLTEKLADLFHSPERYVAMFGYERSVVYPDGHRNIMHAERGVPAFPLAKVPDSPARSAGSVIPDDTKRLYEEVRRSGGVSIPHTSATRMGTDWRDNDPEIEPVVEIFQGDRHSYESPDAPLKDIEPQPMSPLEEVRPKGFVSNAWAKGYRLGVIASSDHFSTHISYALVWAEGRTREAVLEAVKKRRTYAATDNIILEFWIGNHFMGEEFAADTIPPIRIKAVGTRPFASVEIVRNNQCIFRSGASTEELDITYQDMEPASGLNFYYVRVQQVDGMTAWSSPIWINK